MQADGTWSYALTSGIAGGPDIPNGEFHDVFSYTVSDGHGGFDTATLDITVYGGPFVIGVPPDDPLW